MASFHNRALAQTAALIALTDDQVRAIRTGDFVLECGVWCRIETVNFTTSVSGWPIANVCAVSVDNPLFRASLCLSRAVPARRFRFASQSQAA
jgi:hypothetical protein